MREIFTKFYFRYLKKNQTPYSPEDLQGFRRKIVFQEIFKNATCDKGGIPEYKEWEVAHAGGVEGVQTDGFLEVSKTSG